MELRGARANARIAQNPDCELQTAMAVERVNEVAFYRQLAGEEYQGETGQRESARRRGDKFEANLYQNDAALLRGVLGPLYGLNPDTMVVRNLVNEVPGANNGEGVLALRLVRTRRILRDLALGRRVPHLVIQPQLVLPTGQPRVDEWYITPDYLVLDVAARIYVPGELKSFVVRNSVPEKSDREPSRRQAAVQILALRGEMGQLGLDDRVTNRASFVFSTPYGLKPAPAFQEWLNAEVRDAERAIQRMTAIRQRLVDMRRVNDAELWALAEDLRFNYQDNCIGNCILASICKQRLGSRAGVLGDAVRDFAGQDMEIERLLAIRDGAEPNNAYERALADQLAKDMNILGLIPGMRRSA